MTVGSSLRRARTRGRVLASRSRPGQYAAAAFKFRQRVGVFPNMVRPRTFNEKVLYKKFHDRRAYLVRTQDKLAVREHVAALVGDGVLPRLYAVIERPEELDLAGLPPAFVLKPTHGSGWVELVPDARSADVARLRALVDEWLMSVFGEHKFEWWYREIPPRVIAEEFLRDERSGTSVSDYKFFVMNGVVRLIQVDLDRHHAHTLSFYTPEWEHVPVSYNWHPVGPPDLPPPPNLGSMFELARTLAAGTDFVRVDLYDLGDRVVFGELTHCPVSGMGRFSDPAFDRWLGDQWEQPRSYSDPALCQS